MNNHQKSRWQLQLPTCVSLLCVAVPSSLVLSWIQVTGVAQGLDGPFDFLIESSHISSGLEQCSKSYPEENQATIAQFSFPFPSTRTYIFSVSNCFMTVSRPSPKGIYLFYSLLVKVFLHTPFFTLCIYPSNIPREHTGPSCMGCSSGGSVTHPLCEKALSLLFHLCE